MTPQRQVSSSCILTGPRSGRCRVPSLSNFFPAHPAVPWPSEPGSGRVIFILENKNQGGGAALVGLRDIGRRGLPAGDLKGRVVGDVRRKLDAFLDLDVFPLHEEPGGSEEVCRDAGVELVAFAFARLCPPQSDIFAVHGLHRIDGEVQLTGTPEAALVFGFDDGATGGGTLLDDQDAVHADVFGDFHPDPVINLGSGRRDRFGHPEPNLGAVGNHDPAGLGGGGQSGKQDRNRKQKLRHRTPQGKG